MPDLKITPVLENAEVEKDLKRLETAFQDLYSALKNNDFGELFGKQMSDIASSAEGGETAIKDLFSAIGEQGKNAKALLKDMRSSVQELVDSMRGMEGVDESVEEYENLVRALDSLDGELDDNSQAVDEAVGKYNDLADSQREVGQVSDDMLDALRGSYDFILGKTQDLEGTIKKVYTAYGGFQQLMKNSGVDITGATVKMAGLQKASLALGKALVRAGLSANAAKIALASLGALPVVAAITAIIIVLRKLIKHHQELKAAAEESKRAQEEFNSEVSKGAAPGIAKFRELQTEWNSLSTDMAKTEFLERSKKAFDELGISVNSLQDAQNVLVDNADAYYEAQIKMAQADVYRARVRTQTEELVNLQEQLAGTEPGKKRKVKVKESYIDDMGNEVYEDVVRKLDEREVLQGEIKKKQEEINKTNEKILELSREGAGLLDDGGLIGPRLKPKGTKKTKGSGGAKDNADPEKTLQRILSSVKSKSISQAFEDMMAADSVIRDYLNEPVDTSEVEDSYADLIESYGTYEEKRLAIHMKYLGKINAADGDERTLYQKAMEEELVALELSSGKLAAALSEPFKQTSKEISDSLDAINKALENSKDLTPESIKALQEAREKLIKTQLDLTPTGMINGIGRNLRNGGTLGGFFDGFKKAWDEAKPQERTEAVAGFVGGIADGMKTATDYMLKFADATGNAKLKEVAESASAAASFIGDTAKGFAQGGLIGGAVAAVGNALKQTAEAFTRSAAETREMKENAQDFADAMRLAALEVDSMDFQSIFGTDKNGLMEEYSKKAADATAAYRSEINKITGMMVKTKDNTGWANLWGVKDQYTSLMKLAPQILKNGELNVTAAENFLATNTQITDEQRKQIKNLIELKKAEEENLDALKGELSSTFGGLSDAMSDAIVNAIRSGENEMYALRDAGLDVINSLERQLVSGIFNEYLSNYQDEILDVISKGGNEKDIMAVYSEIFDNLEGVSEIAANAAKVFEEQARDRGWDVGGGSQNVSASSKGFAAMSQDTASELNGRFTALQISNETIAQNALIQTGYLLTIKDLMAGSGSVLTDIRNMHAIEASHLEDIAKFTKPIPSMVETLDKIQRNTAKL